jgi:hypothetical protein
MSQTLINTVRSSVKNGMSLERAVIRATYGLSLEVMEQLYDYFLGNNS